MNARRIGWMLAVALSWPLGSRLHAQQSMPGMDMSTPTQATPAKKPRAKKDDHLRHAKAKHDMPMSGMPMQSMPGMQMPAASSSTMQASSVAQPSSDKPPNDHVSPAAPSHLPSPMSPAQMTRMMQMDDQATRAMWLVDRLERTRDDDGRFATAWETDAWWGNDIDKLWLRSEGETNAQGTRDARAELLWDHAFSTFWDWRLGARDDFGAGPSRQWLAFGVQGLAPYWFDLGATFYVGQQGRAAARLEASYDLRVSRHLLLTPNLELNIYDRRDPLREVRAGLSDAQLGLRLRYEISRRFAPYVGVNWNFQREREMSQHPPPTLERTWLLGLRFWF
jgi:copper resistance protein B